MRRFKFAISTLAFICVIQFASYAQDDWSTRKEIGFSGGATFSTISTYDQNETKLIAGTFLQGYHAGFFYKYVGEKNLGIIAEANYDQLGYKMVNGDEVKLDYISIPLLSHFYIGHKPSHIFINLGPEMSFLINESGSSEFGPVERKSVFGLCGGLGYNKAFKKSKIGIEYRYHFTVMSNNKTEGTEAERRNSWMGVSLFYSFRLK